MNEPHRPTVTYLCDCCENGSPVAVCASCRRDWPCPDYVASHTEARVNAQRRWSTRVQWRPDAEMVKWEYRRQGIEPTK